MSEFKPFTKPKLSTFKLRDYQIQGVEFLQERKRVMLLDAPGLGKTPQAAFASVPPTIIVCPAYLVVQWRDWLIGEDEESMKRNNGEKIPNVEGRVLAALGLRYERAWALQQYDVSWLVVNTEMLDNYPEFKDSVWKRRWRTIVFDESHHLKSHNGKRAKIAVEFAKNAEYVYLLTATPVKREIDDFFMQFRILHPDVFTSYWKFTHSFCEVEENYFGTQIQGAKKSMLPELQQILEEISMGRSYQTAGRELPPIIEKYITLDLPPEAKKLYNAAIDDWRITLEENDDLPMTNYMQVMHLLRQHVTGYWKVDAVAQILEDAQGNAVSFSWYKPTARAIAAKLGEGCVYISGDMDMKIRRQVAFNALASGQNVSATIASIPEGVDLSAARNCIFAEEDWTPGSNYQALSRVDRERLSGHNEEPVIVYYVHCRDTIDEVIHNVSKRRAGTVKDVVKESLYLR